MFPVASESTITPTPWLSYAMARMIANTTIPRISNTTPVLLTIATSLTPKMLRTVMRISVMTATTAWSALPRFVLKLVPSIVFSIGSSAIGSVAQTEATVRIPATR